MLDYDLVEPSLRMVVAVLVGGVIGLDRAYRGRAAGFRTHILVCLASSVLMMLMDYPWLRMHAAYADLVRVDPTRMAQGIMTGIGFLGAGVIMQHKQSVRGLTTAASIWVTASIGILIGAGVYSVALLATLLTLITLAIFNRLIDVLPMRHYALMRVSFKRDEYLTKEAIEDLLSQQKAVISSLIYKLENEGKAISYQMTIRSTRRDYLRNVAEAFLAIESVQEFLLEPLGD